MNLKLDLIYSADEFLSEDCAHLYQIDTNYFPTPWDQLSWQQLFFESSRMLCIARSPEKIIGFVLYDFNTVDSFAHLLKIIILPELRNMHIGEQLLQATIESLAKEKMVQHYFLEVEATNLSAVNLYKKCGFKIIHTKKDFYGTAKDAFVMTI